MSTTSQGVDWGQRIQSQESDKLRSELHKPIAQRKPIKVIKHVPDYDAKYLGDRMTKCIGSGCFMRRNIQCP